MPRPMAAGVFGIARTSAAPGRAASRRRKVRPAMMETTTVVGPKNGVSTGITSGALCGLTAITTAAASPTAPGVGLRRRPCRAQAVISLAGCGSIAAIFSGPRPSASQPSSMALPILPAPASRMVPERVASERAAVCEPVDGLMAATPAPMPCGSAAGSLRLPLRLEHGGVERLARGLAGPDHELEGREVALAGVERGAQERFALPARGFDAAGQHQRVPVHDQPVLGPEVEMPDPHLLVDQRDQQLHLAVQALRHLELEGAGEMQRLDVEHPGVGDLVVRPLAGHQDGDFVLARALERPAVGAGHPLDDVEGVHVRLFGKFDEGHARLHPCRSDVGCTPDCTPLRFIDAVAGWSAAWLLRANHLMSRI